MRFGILEFLGEAPNRMVLYIGFAPENALDFTFVTDPAILHKVRRLVKVRSLFLGGTAKSKTNQQE